ncbi:MAG: membrane protein insertase YidC, partial [Cyclobacteriaceae bacterium]|nr:membrane protein insertase YidC [Cyclobacteriaceae bacterium]
MDRNQAIGLTLMALVLLIYFIWFAPQPEPLPPVADSVVVQNLPTVSQPDKPQAVQSSITDSLNKENEQPQDIEITTQDLKIIFSSRGGIIRSLELNHFKTYHQKPVRLIQPDRHEFELIAQVTGQPLNIYALNFTASQQKKGDTTMVYFTRTAGEKMIQLIYTIPPTGYEIGYTIVNKNYLDNAPVELRWRGRLPLFERDLTDSRNYTTIVYRNNDEVDELSARSLAEQQTLSGKIDWVSVKQKFFLNAVISDKGFSQAVM